MKKLILPFAFLFLSSFAFQACSDDEEKTVDTSVLGTVTIELDATKPVVRGVEAKIGNMIADAWMTYLRDSLNIADVQFALPNGGNIRYDETIRPNGIYPAGDYTMEIVNEICFYDNNLMSVSLTGAQLKSCLERSVSSLPDEYKGWFLQASKEFQYTVDLSKQAQVLDETDPDHPTIATEGERIVSMKINGQECNPESTYKFLGTDYMIQGNDGYVMLGQIPESQKQNLGDYRKALIFYLKHKSPITPTLSNRIVFQAK